MKRAGRIHWMVVVALATLIALVSLFVFSGDSPDKAAREFMSALAKGDAKALASRSYLNLSGKSGSPSSSLDGMEKAWKECLDGAKYYRFVYTVGDVQIQPDQSASVRLQINKNPFGMGGYDEHFELPMFKEEGKWKVQVQGISREMYPFLPR